ncbi:MAG: ABC transporter permease [Ruminococcaceae bacterium]|nr:ABC transporter permease [Oscillospiraceae bacterium]
MTRKENIKKGSPKKPVSRIGLLQRYAAAPHIVWSVLFVVAPLIFVLYYAFTDASGAFTTANVSAFFTEKYLLIFFRSLKLAVIATAICLLLGYPIAYFISRSKARTQKILILLLMLPMWMNFLIRTYAIMVLIQDTGIINTFLGNFGIDPIHILGTEGAVIIGMVYDYLPFMILPIYSVMAKIDNRLIEAASDLGCNGFGVLRKVILPLSKSGVISGLTMVLVPSISTFYISQKLGGVDTLMIGDVIEQQYTASNYNMTASLSLILMLILLIGLAIVNHYSDDESGGGMVL